MNDLVEIWKDIPESNGAYQVSNYGRVRSVDHWWKNRLQKGKVLSPLAGRYQRVMINRKAFLIHRLVAQAFIPNPNNLPEINHKDENKFNNRVDNLEWCTHEYNNNYGTRNKRSAETRERNGCFRPCVMLDKAGNPLKEFSTIKEAADYLGGSKCNIWLCLNNKSKTAYGYKWIYQKERIPEQ